MSFPRYAVGTPAATGNLPTSAPVIDFICLFTHDLKRKQKRWQDGVLKYHAFNKRVMVYDDRSHFIGDAHWQAEGHLEEGDELKLDRGGAIVQVAECTGHREQDLTGLLDKRAREVEKRRATAGPRTPAPSVGTVVPGRPDQISNSQLRHRPLSDMLGTPARIGRAAIPSRSPYETRQIAAQEAQPSEERRPTKRRRQQGSESPPSKSCHARSLFGATLTLSSQPVSRLIPKSRAQASLKSLLPPDEETENLHTAGDCVIIDLETPSTGTGVREHSTRSALAASSHHESHASSTQKTKVPPSVGKPKSHITRLPLDKVDLTRPEKASRSRPPPEAPLAASKLVARTQGPVLSTREHNVRSNHVLVDFGSSSHIKDRDGAVTEPDSIESNQDDPRPQPQESIANPMIASRDGPRTELRIKPRHKRGLLCISGKWAPAQHNMSSSRSVAKETEPRETLITQISVKQDELLQEMQPTKGFDTFNDHGRAPAPNSNQEKLIKPIIDNNRGLDEDFLSEEGEQSPESVTSPNLSSYKDEPPLRRQRIKRQLTSSDESGPDEPRLSLCPTPKKSPPREHGNTVSEDHDIDSNSFPAVVEKRKQPQRAKRSSETNDKDSNAGPRIAKMARKSVKSKEIIGFIPSTEPLVPPHIAVGLSRGRQPKEQDIKASDAPAPSHSGKPPERKAREASKEVMVAGADANAPKNTTVKLKPKLNNPATRGKKAARREDASGQAPQTLVNLDPVAAPRDQLAPKLATPQKQEDEQVPGFSRANGGAWSRHAEDLLGMARPSEKAPQLV